MKSLLKGAECPQFVKEETIADIFREAAARYSDKVALIFGDIRFTYRELDQWSDQIALFILGKGMGRGSAIGVWHTRGPELHAVILGIVKAGAAYVPLDREMPAERLQVVMEEVRASACFSDAVPALCCPVFTVPAYQPLSAGTKVPVSPVAGDPAYVLYTSGSTGKPKGIAILHRNICHLIRSEQSVIGIRSSDKVYQGFAVSFDMWCEETWISFFAGASIWVADSATSKSIDELSSVLRQQEITVLHAVPSLLAVMDDDIPSLRMVNAGGEACTPAVLNRWSKPGKNVFYNSYGPTETTVTSTMIALKPGDPITIGAPLPNYNLAVVDDQFQIQPRGAEGQLVITGPGVCPGYVNRDDLTAQKFIPRPVSMADIPGETVYLTGDAVIMEEDGRITFIGRMDDQVKLRGFRIELGEIEVKLSELEGVLTAAVSLKKDSSGENQLVGYVTLPPDAAFDEHSARMALARVLPSYMVPIAIMRLARLPRLSSGKIDRRSLPLPAVLLTMENKDKEQIDPSASVEEKVMEGLRRLFPGREISPDQDFFTDLGGHSLLAATFASWLRNVANLPFASLKDLYTSRPLKNLVETWEQSEKTATGEDECASDRFRPVSSLRYWLCGAAQGLALLFVFMLFAIQIFVPYLGYYYVVAQTESGRDNRGIAILTSLLLFCVIPPFLSLVAIGLKWLVLGKVKEGDHPLWGTYYFRYWFVNTILRLVPAEFMNGTPVYPLFLRLLGARVAKNAQLSAITIGSYDLVEIGEDASLSSGVVLNNVFVENGMICFRRIKIGNHGYIGSGSVLSGSSEVKEWGELQDLSHLSEGQVIEPFEVWKGSPASKAGKMKNSDIPEPLDSTPVRLRSYGLLYSLLLVVFPIVVLIPLLPVIEILNYMDLKAPDYDFSYFIYVPLLTLLYIVLYAFETVVLSRLLMRNIKPGVYPVFSAAYVRKWLSDQIISVALIVLHPIYASVFVSFFFRMLGAKVGKNTEISTASNVTHTMLEIGEGSFIADAVTLGEEDVRGQRLTLAKTTIGNASFVGNSALIPQGYRLGDRMLIGVLSVPPTYEQLQQHPGGDWFGSPAIALPHRQESGQYDPSLTTNPPLRRKLARGAMESIRIILPETVIICCSVLFIAYCHDLVADRSPLDIIRQIPILSLYYLYYMGLPALAVTILLKWLVVGKYRSEQMPMWTNKVWRSEAITTTYEALAVPFLLDFLRGTPFLPVALRLFGVKIGKRAWLNTTDITEFDMVSIGDDSSLNEDCGPQTHLFEDRVMKIGSVAIGARCSIGSRTILLYDSEIGDDVIVKPLSLVMKGERLSDGTAWSGSPIRARSHQARQETERREAVFGITDVKVPVEECVIG